jgi:hypothetical protein
MRSVPGAVATGFGRFETDRTECCDPIATAPGTDLVTSAMSLRDGVTGNTSGFELEDEGSTPSPAAISFLKFAKRYFDCHSRNK